MAISLCKVQFDSGFLTHNPRNDLLALDNY